MEDSGSRPVAGRPPVERMRIHQALVDRVRPAPGDVLLDLGCGSGLTLAAAAGRTPGLSLIGIDVDAGAVTHARSWLEETDAGCRWFVQDLADPLPVEDASVDAVVCHDVLEYLDEPGDLLAEAHRVLRPGGTSVWSHVDYEGIVVGGADDTLTRRVLAAYAEAAYLESRRSDARIARRLPAIVDRSPLARTGVDGTVLVATTLEGPGRHRVEDIAAVVARRDGAGRDGLEAGSAEAWLASLAAADERGEFFYAHTAYMVTAVKAAAAA